MADMNPQDMTNAFLEALREFHKGGKDPAIGGGGGGKSTMGNQLGDAAAKSLQDLGKEVNKLIKNVKTGSGALDTYTRLMKGSGMDFVDIQGSIESLDKAIKQADKDFNLGKKVSLERQKADLEVAAGARNTKVALGNMALGAGQALKNNLLPAIGSFVKGLQGNASSAELSSTLFTGAIDAAGGAGQAIGGTMAGLGGAMAGMSGKVGMVGKGLAVLGPILSNVSAAGQKLLKTGLSILVPEVQKTIKAFNAGSNAGALFAGGMTEMRSTANAAGLTLDQFSAVMQKNSADLADSGLGVAQAAKLMGGAMKAGGGQMQTELLKLGYGFEEQSSLVAETMASMRKGGRALTAGDQAAIAQQTAKYAENLRVITAVTGEDARKKMEQVKAQANQLAFQQKLAEMGPERAAAVERAMANMSAQQQKNFMDSMVFGQVINKAGAAMESTSTNFAANNAALVEAAKNGTLDAESARAINTRYAEGVRQDMLNQKEIGMAAMAGSTGLSGELSKVMLEELQLRRKQNADAVKDAEANVKGQAAAVDKLTTDLMAAERAGQGLKLELEKSLTPAIAKYSEVSKLMLEGVQTMLKDAGIGTGPTTKSDSGAPKAASPESKATGEAIGSVAGTAIGMAIGSVVPVIGTAIGGLLGGFLGSMVGGKIVESQAGTTDKSKAREAETLKQQQEDPAAGLATGGISIGPEDGYLQKLHGRELVIPLKGSGLDTDSIGYSQLIGKLATSSEVDKTRSNASALSQGSGTLMPNGQRMRTLADARRGAATSQASVQVRDPAQSAGFLSNIGSAIKTAFDGGPSKTADGLLEMGGNAVSTGKSALSSIKDSLFGGEGDQMQATNIAEILERQTEVLENIALYMQEMNNATNDALSYQKVIADNTY